MWRSVTTSDRFSAVLASIGCSPEGIRRRDFVVVAHARGTRHDLVVFDPGFARSRPVTVRLPSKDAVALATSGVGPDARFDLTPDEIRRAVVEAATVGTYGVVLTAPPLTRPTSCPTPGLARRSGRRSQPGGQRRCGGL